ncbi:MAG: AMIN domain-containing protein, partial [Terriglobales bacterium]
MLEIISSRPLVPAISKLDNPPRLVIDLPNARLAGHEKRLDFRGSEINGVRLNQFQQDPPVARIVVDLSKPVAYTWDAAGNRLMVRIHP